MDFAVTRGWAKSLQTSVNGAGNRFDVEDGDQTFDLPPATKMDVISDITAGFRAFSRLQSCAFPEPGDQRLCVLHIAGIYV